MTYTYAIADVSVSAYHEIRAVLAEAGYAQAFHEDSDGAEVIDMRGIALREKPDGNSQECDGNSFSREAAAEPITVIVYRDVHRATLEMMATTERETRREAVIAALCEIARLNARVTELQAANTREVERRRVAESDRDHYRAAASPVHKGDE